MFLSSKIWGPHYWFFLHTISLTYPDFPTDTDKKIYYDLIQNFHRFIPNKKMGDTFLKNLDNFPISPYLTSRLSFIKWVNYIHNKMNGKLEKKNDYTLFECLKDL